MHISSIIINRFYTARFEILKNYITSFTHTVVCGGEVFGETAFMGQTLLDCYTLTRGKSSPLSASE